METNENAINYAISTHAKQRYAERIMGKEDIDVNRFVTLNEDKIKTDINKMNEVRKIIWSKNKGDRVVLKVKRGLEYLNLEVELK